MTVQTLPYGATRSGRRLPPETRVPTPSQYEDLTLRERAEAARVLRVKRRLTHAELDRAEGRLRESERLADAYRVKAWAERRWPEPDSVGVRRLRLAVAEVAAASQEHRSGRTQSPRMAGSANR